MSLKILENLQQQTDLEGEEWYFKTIKDWNLKNWRWRSMATTKGDFNGFISSFGFVPLFFRQAFKMTVAAAGAADLKAK